MEEALFIEIQRFCQLVHQRRLNELVITRPNFSLSLDPGAFMDRSLLEGDPHIIIEGMAIAGYAIGAQKGFIYVRAEYPLAVERIEQAIAQAHAYGLLGDNIFGSGLLLHRFASGSAWGGNSHRLVLDCCR